MTGVMPSSRFVRFSRSRMAKALGFSQTEAARRVGYGQPGTAAYRLMQQPHVRAAIAKIKAEADPTTAEAW
jgi:hypothetical protein